MTFRTQRGSKPIISLFHWCFAIHLLNPTRFTLWSRCLNGKLSMTSFDNCTLKTYGTLLQRGQRKFRRLVFNDRVKRKPQVNWDPVHMYELSSVFAVHTPTNSPNRRYSSSRTLSSSCCLQGQSTTNIIRIKTTKTTSNKLQLQISWTF